MKTPMVRIFNLAHSSRDFEPHGAAHWSSAPPSVTSTVAGEQQREDAAALILEMEKQRATERRTQAGIGVKDSSSPAKPKSPERRHRRRAKISAPVRLRQSAAWGMNEYDVTMTMDVSREGLLFETARSSYVRGQELAIVFPYRPAPGEPLKEQRGQVVRVSRSSEKRYSVAVAFLEGEPQSEIVDALGRPLQQEEEPPRERQRENVRRPFILIADYDEISRAALRTHLECEGYLVEAVPSPDQAVPVLRHRQPAALICDAEPLPGAMPDTADMSGYDLCVVIRRNPKLARIPVLLTTRTALPSDFATAHALGATVCVAKPYDLGRVGHLMRMLVPIEELSARRHSPRREE